MKSSNKTVNSAIKRHDLDASGFDNLYKGLDNSSKATFKVEEDMLGGIKIRIGNKIIDGSLSTKLEKVKKSLLSV